nr:uncharacterized protein LOC128694440 isoform X1 [Cherax quadricarinatus]
MHRDLWGGIHGDLQGGMHGDLLGDMHRDLRVVFTGTSGWHAQGPSEWHAQEPRVAFTGTSGVASTGTMVACMVTSRVACTGTSKVACTGTSGWRSQGPSGWHAPEPSGWHAQGLWGCVDGDLQSGMQRDLRVAFTRTSGWHAQGPLGWHAQGPRGGVQKDIRSGMHRDLQGGVHRDLQDGGVRGPPLWHAQEPQGGMHRDLGVVCTGTSRAALNPYGSFNARHCGSSILHLLSANAMALDWRGEYTLLAGRRNLALISLNKPSEVVKRVSRTRQKYDVTAAEWNPIQSQGHTFVLASGERAEICQWTEGSLNGTTSLRAHTRTITDLNWHRFDPHVLATCSIDTFVHIWDTRETRKPVASLSAIAGASQVKWNKLNHNFLASGHDCNIRVWDNRKTSQPAQYIAAHLSKIQGLDWSPNHENHLVTSSNDCTVKFFNITNPRKAENFINTLSPVWRARYTPFGEGVVTVVVPQLRRGENSLLLWSVTDMSAPVHTFVGHSDVVLEFEWRQNTNNPGEHQLVTWARDQSLRIWKIDQHLQRLCGHDIEDDAAFAESTDSEFANEAAPVQGESECDMEKFDEKDKTGEQDTLDPVQDTKQQCTQQNAENTERASHENSPEIGLATSDAPQTYDELQGSLTNDQFTGDTGTANVPVLPPVTSFLNTVSAPIRTNHNVVSLTSTLPSGGISAGQPMSLQQEFSLLNTSLDNSQVNSVEVVGGGIEVLAGAEGKTHGQDDKKVAREEGRLETRSENNAREEVRLHSGDGSDLVNEVTKLEGELGDDAASNLEKCHINLKDKKKSVLDVYNKGIGCHIKSKTNFNSYIQDFRTNISCDMTKKVLSVKTNSEINLLAMSYITGLECSDQDLISRVNLDDSSACLMNDKSSLNFPGGNKSSKEQTDNVVVDEESPVKITVKSKGWSECPSEPAILDMESVPITSDRPAACLLSNTGGRQDLSKSTEISIISVTPEVPTPVQEVKEVITNIDTTKEETVIHVINNGNMSSNEENSVCSTSPSIHTLVETVDASNENQILLKREIPDNISLTLSLPLVNAPNAAVIDGSFMIKHSNDAPLQVPAKLIYIPDTEDGSLEFSEEMCAALSPQLFEGGALVQGENIVVLGNQSYLTSVELVVIEGETQTQISISPLVESLRAYQDRGVNFLIITRDLEQSIALSSNSSQAFLKIDLNSSTDKKISVKNAPHCEEPGLFQCDKCDKTYKVRSSLNSHKVTHNVEKMYKCDECDKAFHYSTPLQIHKRIHSDERPYRCHSCTASFRSKANLRYHERLHTGERPITCQECGRGFKDYTSLKRHRQKAHGILNVKCVECGQMCNSLDGLTNHLLKSHNIFYVDKLEFCEKCGEPFFAPPKAFNIHVTSHECAEKISQGAPGKLSDYIHQCGICNMICQNKPQMLVHIQIHAAIKRFQCRYCKNAYMYRFLLARHVREEHPDNPQWFCQYCDETFATCRKMNTHSCRTVRGNYNCPHCDFKTEIRHRLFRHIVKEHPSDKAPYYCDFCKSSYEDPSKLRYHQKREHPEKMLMLTVHRETAKHLHGAGDKSDSPSIDMSQVEMTVEGNTIIYYIPKHLRNDDVFKEKVKFKCFYCEAKFPVKNSMTRHILREHPNEKAYKCLQCNIFLRSNVESKNHHRKYHKYLDTGGRDPLRNEKAMKKKAQMLEEKLKHAGAELKNIYKFGCRFCSMVYRSKRPLIVHYKKWHPDEEWDHFPDKPSRITNLPSKKKRKLLFFECVFEEQCQKVFDDITMILDHLANAHHVDNKEANKYIHKRIVVEAVRCGRLPRNAIDVVTKASSKAKRTRRKNNAGIKLEAEDEEIVDDPAYFEERVPVKKIDRDLKLFDKMKTRSELPISSLNDTQHTKSILLSKSVEKEHKLGISSKKASKSYMNLEDIGSVRDVKKMLYRCRKCGISFSSKLNYREHSSQYSQVDCREFLHLNIKKDSGSDEDNSDEYYSDENYQVSSGQEDDDSEGNAPQRNKKSHSNKKKERGLTNLNSIVKMEVENSNQNIVEDIIVTSLDEDNSEAVLKILTISSNEFEHSGIQSEVEMSTLDFSNLNSGPTLISESENIKLNTFNVSLTPGDKGKKREVANEKFNEAKKLRPDNSCSKNRSDNQSTEMEVYFKNRRQSKVPALRNKIPIEKNKDKVPQIKRASRGTAVIEPRLRRLGEAHSRSHSVRENNASQTTQCEECHLIFQTRAELSFHKRLDHR